MNLNYLAIVVFSILSYIGGFIWYGAIFNKYWEEIHGIEKYTKKEKKKIRKTMLKTGVIEFIMTFLIIFGLACLIKAIPQYSGVRIGLMTWTGFILPTTVSNIIWGSDKSKYKLNKILIIIIYRLIMLLSVGYGLSIWI